MSFELYNRNDKQRKCKICEEVFVSVKGREVCSDICERKRKAVWLKNKVKRKTRFKIVCEYCEKTTMVDKNPGRRAYCNSECKRKAKLQRDKEERAIRRSMEKPKPKEASEINPMFLDRGTITYNNQG